MSRGTRTLTMAALAMAMMLLAATAASGAPDKDCNDPRWADHPACQSTTTTTEAPEGAPSCYQRVREMGATGWAYDPVDPGETVYPTETQWNGSAYVQAGIPMCIDLDQPGHTAALTWQVAWSGGETARQAKGIKLVFEQGVHGTLYAEHVSTSVSGEWIVSIDPNGAEPLVLVAMPRAGDRWTTVPTFTVRPAGN